MGSENFIVMSIHCLSSREGGLLRIAKIGPYRKLSGIVEGKMEG